MRRCEPLLETGDSKGAIEATSVGRLAIPEHEGLLRVRIAALAALGDAAGARHEVNVAIEPAGDTD